MAVKVVGGGVDDTESVSAIPVVPAPRLPRPAAPSVPDINVNAVNRQVTEQVKQQNEQRDYYSLIKQRTSSWDPSFWQQNPTLATYLATSSLPDKVVQSVATYWPQLTRSVGDANEFAGVSGALVQLRLKALSTQDPALRTRLLLTVDALQGLAPGRQQELVTWLQHPTFDRTPVQAGEGTGFRGNTAALTPPVSLDDMSRVLGVDSGSLRYGADGKFHVTGESFDTGFVANQTASLESLFPELRGKIQFDAEGITPADVRDSFDLAQENYRDTYFGFNQGETLSQYYQRRGAVGASYHLLRGGAFIAPGAPGFALAGGLLPVRAAGLTEEAVQAVQAARASAALVTPLGLQATQAGLGELAAKTPNAPILPGVNAQQLSSGYNLTLDTYGRLQTQLGKVLTLGRVQSPEAQTDVGGFALAVGLPVATEGLADVKVVRTMPEDVAARVLGVADDSGQVVKPTAALAASLTDTTVAQRAFHPFRTYVAPMVRSLVVGTFGKTAEEFYGNPTALGASRGAFSLFDYADELNKNSNLSSESRTTALMQGYPGLTEGSAQAVLSVPREDMPATMARRMTGAPPEDIAAAQRAVDQQERVLAKTEQGVPPPVTIRVPLDVARSLLEFPERGAIPRPVGEVGTAGPLTLDYDPTSGKGIISEGTHRIVSGAGPGIDGQSANLEVRFVTTEEVERQGSLVRGAPAQELPPDLVDQVQKSAFSTPGPGVINDEAISAARAELLSRQEKLNSLVRDPWQTRFPGAGEGLQQFFRKMFRWPTRVTGFTRLLHTFLSPVEAAREFNADYWQSSLFETPKSALASRLTDKLEVQPYLLSPLDPAVPRELALDQSLTTIRRVSARFGLTPEETLQVQTSFRTATSAQDISRFMERWGNTIRPHISGAPPWVVDDVLSRFSPSSYGPDYNSLEVTKPDGTVVREPVFKGDVVNGVVEAKSILPSEFVGTKISLPTTDQIAEATSAWRNWTDTWKRSPSFMKRFSSEALTTSSIAARLVGRGLMFPIDLTFRLPALIIRHATDGALTNYVTAGVVEGQSTRDFYSQIERPSGQVIGNAFDDLMEGERPRVRVTRPTTEFIVNGQLTDAGAAVLVEKMDYYRKDPLTSALLKNGVDGVMAKMQDPSTPLGRIRQSMIGSAVADDAQLKEVLGRQLEAVNQAALGSDRFVDYIKNGKFKKTAPVDPAAVEAQAQLDDLRQRLSGAPIKDSAGTIVVVQRELLDRLINSDETTRLSKPAAFGEFGNGKDLQAEVQAAYARGELQLPKDVSTSVSRGPKFGSESLSDKAAAIYRNLTGITYQGFKAIGAVEGKFREQFFDKQYFKFYKEFQASGLTGDELTAAATMKAGLATRDFWYSLASRSTAERGIRNVFWYGSAQGELLYKWLYAIPAQSYWLPGLLLRGAELTNFVDLMKNMGVIQRDSKGQLAIPLSGVSRLISTLSGGKINPPSEWNVELKTLDPLITGGFLPTVQPLVGDPLTKMARYVPMLRQLNNIVDPYGDSATLIPHRIQNFLGIFGIHVADPLNEDYVRAENSRVHDNAVALAYSDLQRSGDDQPTQAQFNLQPGISGYIPLGDPRRAAAEKAFNGALTAWYDRLMSNANSVQKGLYLGSFLGGSVIPGHVDAASPAEAAWTSFFTKNILPRIQGNPSSQTLLVVKQMTDKWLAQHPDSFAFTVSTGYYTGNKPSFSYDTSSNTAYRDLYLSGAKQVMTADEFSKFLLVRRVVWLNESKINQAINEVSPAHDPVQVLENFGIRQTAVRNAQDSLQQWRDSSLFNQSAYNVFERNKIGLDQFYGVPQQSVTAQYLSSALLGVSSLSNLFTGEGGVTSQQYDSVVSQLKAARAQLFQQVKANPALAQDKLTQGLSWYFDSYLGPYMSATQGLWQQATSLSDQGKRAEASAIYAKIDAVRAQYEGTAIRTHGGEVYPTADQFFYGSKTPREQQIALYSWASKPQAWLSDWQRQKLGYTTFSNEDQMWSTIQQIKDSNDLLMVKLGIAPTSTQGQQMLANTDALALTTATSFGAQGLAAYQLDQAAPYVRMQQLGMFKDDPVMQQAFNFATLATTQIQAAGDSPTSYSQVALQAKMLFYVWLRSQLANPANSQFRNDMENLSLGLTSGPKGTHPMGAYLTESVFFGQFQPAFVPSTLTEAA